ncbi:signal peptidase II [Patescibacteria group bacterium]|nr:signal peptidase II [Patescibacteria group bacterium]
MKRFYIIIPLLVFSADRIIKYFASSINLGGGFVKVGLYKNYAGAFSLPIAGTVYNILGVFLILIFVYLLIKELRFGNPKKIFAFQIIILGGVSNIFDRLYFGYVIDYIQIINRSFFNIADLMLIAGVATLLAKQIKRKTKSEKGKTTA